ncbi:gluzincin family metallopeptidase [Micromonospora aurantiaca (nom. illeg.)]|uniref:hypothetical protein n=1 Tax=Micromonospora aurantiaca (nom. illeg.) TaxID=47850 RepID=UPI0036B444E1
MRRALTAAIAALTLTAAGTTVTGAPGQAAPTGWGRPQPAAATPTPGSPGLGDSYFPDYGNGGYDVGHYDIRLRYEPATDRLSGTTTILATATKDLSRFNLDFALDVESVRVNGWVAGFARAGDHELVITPARPLTKGQQLTVVVRYAGVPSQTTVYGYTAWTRTADGALAVNEPESAWWWYPSNDHPKDKATWDVSVSVPTGVEVISNGVQPRDPLPEPPRGRQPHRRSRPRGRRSGPRTTCSAADIRRRAARRPRTVRRAAGDVKKGPLLYLRR